MIELLIINSLIIWGIYTSLQEGMIFEKVGNWIKSKSPIFYTEKEIMSFKELKKDKDNLPFWIKKPLATCPICMSSVYGTPVFWYAYLTGLIQYDYIIIVYICYEFALAGLNYLILAFMPNE